MSAEPSPFPWDDVLAVALGLLRWRPDDLWRATPRELAAALGRSRDAGPVGRTELADLMRLFPDEDTHG